MKLSTRNQIKGKVVEVVKGAVAAKVKIDIGNGNTNHFLDHGRCRQ